MMQLLRHPQKMILRLDVFSTSSAKISEILTVLSVADAR